MDAKYLIQAVFWLLIIGQFVEFIYSYKNPLVNIQPVVFKINLTVKFPLNELFNIRKSEITFFLININCERKTIYFRTKFRINRFLFMGPQMGEIQFVHRMGKDNAIFSLRLPFSTIIFCIVLLGVMLTVAVMHGTHALLFFLFLFVIGIILSYFSVRHYCRITMGELVSDLNNNLWHKNVLQTKLQKKVAGHPE